MTHDLRKLAEEVEKATIKFKGNVIEIMNTLEEAIGNDVIKNEEISLLLRLRLRRQDATINEKEVLLWTRGNGPVSGVRKSSVTRILLDDFDERASMSRD